MVKVIGVSAAELRDELVAALPWIKIKFPTLHEDTVRHLLSAPHAGRSAAKSYRQVVQVQMALGRNNLREVLPLVRALLTCLS
jgi:hypothetical protein